MKLRRHHQGPTAGGAHSPWDLRLERRESDQPTPTRVLFYQQAQARRDDATSGFPAAFPPLEVAARGDYDATAVASGLGTPGPPCPFRPTLRVAGELEISSGKEFRGTRQRLLGAPRAWKVASTRKRNAPDATQFSTRGALLYFRLYFFAKEKNGLGNLVS